MLLAFNCELDVRITQDLDLSRVSSVFAGPRNKQVSVSPNSVFCFCNLRTFQLVIPCAVDDLKRRKMSVLFC